MWTLIKTQLRYHGSWILMILTPILVFAVGLTGFVSREDRISALWMMFTLVGGLVTLIVFYQQDLRERRPLLWLELPVSPRQVVGARLAVPLFIHLPLLAVAFTAIAILSPVSLDADGVGEVLAGNGLAMLVSYSIYAGEEVGILLAGRRALFWLAQLAFSGTLGAMEAGRVLDEGIVRTLWMTLDEVRSSVARHRSPLLLRCIEDYVAGRRFPLDLIHVDESVPRL